MLEGFGDVWMANGQRMIQGTCRPAPRLTRLTNATNMGDETCQCGPRGMGFVGEHKVNKRTECYVYVIVYVVGSQQEGQRGAVVMCSAAASVRSSRAREFGEKCRWMDGWMGGHWVGILVHPTRCCIEAKKSSVESRGLRLFASLLLASSWDG
jgi:hypothetical protein